MNNFNRGGVQEVGGYAQPLSDAQSRPLIRLVYMWMMFGLLTTALVAGFIGANAQLANTVYQFWWGIVVIELGVGLGLSWGLPRMSPTVAGFFFFLYSALNGLFFGVIVAYALGTNQFGAVGMAFITAAGLFGAMTIVGFVTDVNLSKFSSFFMMAVIGLFIAIVVNIFLGSAMIDMIISIAGVLIFTGLTAFHTQRIKEMAALPQYQQYGSETTKLAIYGAFSLYLAFINLLWFLLRLYLGGRD